MLFYSLPGILLHFDDSLLSDLYFVNPQWLCSMLANVVTVQERNPFQKNGRWDGMGILDYGGWSYSIPTNPQINIQCSFCFCEHNYLTNQIVRFTPYMVICTADE